MLVLTRRTGERVIIDGGRIVVSVESVEGGKVRIGFVADKDITIHRAELQREINSGVRVTPEERAAKKAAAFRNNKGQ